MGLFLIIKWVLLTKLALTSELLLSGRVVAHSAMNRSNLVVDQLSYFSLQPVLNNWNNKGRGMYDHVYKRSFAANQND